MQMIEEKFIHVNQNFDDAKSLLEFVAKQFKQEGKILDEKEYIDGVTKREEEFSTNLGNGFCIPHAKSDTVKESAIAILKNNKKIDYGDDVPADIFFVLAIAGENGNMLHLKVLSQIAQNLMDDVFVENIKKATNASEIYKMISKLNEIGG